MPFFPFCRRFLSVFGPNFVNDLKGFVRFSSFLAVVGRFGIEKGISLRMNYGELGSGAKYSNLWLCQRETRRLSLSGNSLLAVMVDSSSRLRSILARFVGDFFV